MGECLDYRGSSWSASWQASWRQGFFCPSRSSHKGRSCPERKPPARPQRSTDMRRVPTVRRPIRRPRSRPSRSSTTPHSLLTTPRLSTTIHSFRTFGLLAMRRPSLKEKSETMSLFPLSPSFSKPPARPGRLDNPFGLLSLPDPPTTRPCSLSRILLADQTRSFNPNASRSRFKFFVP